MEKKLVMLVAHSESSLPHGENSHKPA